MPIQIPGHAVARFSLSTCILRQLFATLSTFYNADTLSFPALALAAALCAASQSVTAEPQTGASRVALAAVTTARNQPLVDVSEDDFVIQEGGASREILSVRPADYPIIVLVDTGDDPRGDFELMRKAVAQFINRIGQRPVALGTFGTRPIMVTTFEDDRQTVLTKLDGLAAESGAGSLLLQGAALAGETIKSTGALFSAIVIVSATLEDTSRGTAEEMTAPVVDSGAAVHVIANRPAPATGGPAARQPLRALAEQTHGEFTTIYSAASYQSALDRLADRMSSEMMIEYLVPVGSKPKDVKVGTKVIGARVRGLGVAPR